MKTVLHFGSYRGICFDETDNDSACLPYENGIIQLKHLQDTAARTLKITGRIIPLKHANAVDADEDCFAQRLRQLEQPHPSDAPLKRYGLVALAGWLVRVVESHANLTRPPGLRVICNDRSLARHQSQHDGAFEIELALPAGLASRHLQIELALTGVGAANLLAWLGKALASWPFPSQLWARLQKHRLRYFKHRRLRLHTIHLDGQPLLDFTKRNVRLDSEAFRKLWNPGINLIGYFLNISGTGEAVRCAARAAQAADIPTALIQSKFPVSNRWRDEEFAGRLTEHNPHLVNVFHLFPFQWPNLNDHYGPTFRKDKYNIAYWAWELAEFPDAWAQYHRPFDEIWTPSRFTTEAIARKVPVPVLTMPHAIEFPVPTGNHRSRFGLPEDCYLFLFAFDLTSLQARKNPQAVMAAFRKAFPDPSSKTALVVKVLGAENNPRDFVSLQEAARTVPNCRFITDTLSRREVYELQHACDCFVSLHRSEGFGLSVAEAMYLGKPVISTHWSATAEYVNERNGCPVACQLKPLDQSHASYAKGELWAEADVDHAAHFMKRLVANPAWGVQLGRQAAADIRRDFSPAAIGRLYRRRLESMFHW